MSRQVILASGSPRRKELLTLMGVDFTIVVSDFDEYLDDSRPTSEVAIDLALGKARVVAQQYPDAIVIGSDTIPTVNGKQLEKAVDEADARRLLRTLSGTHNDVTTSLAVICKSANIELTDSVTTRVYCKAYDDVVINDYLATGEYTDKAGAYAIQGHGAVLIDHIVGEYDAVMGLPSKALSVMLAQFDVLSQPTALVCPVPVLDK